VFDQSLIGSMLSYTKQKQCFTDCNIVRQYLTTLNLNDDNILISAVHVIHPFTSFDPHCSVA